MNPSCQSLPLATSNYRDCRDLGLGFFSLGATFSSIFVGQTNNLKHKCIVSLLYWTSFSGNELMNLKISDIDCKRMLIRISSGKENKN